MELGMLLILPLAFVCEFVDSTLGMGYGTSLTPILLLMGFEPLQVVPAVLFSEFISGILAGCFHHNVKNADFSPKSRDAKVAIVLSICGIVGTIAAVMLAIKLPKHLLKLWIGLIVTGAGLVILLTLKRQIRFTWPKIAVLGAIASFNKGLSGGGYGPLVTGGQMLSGVNVKNAVGITSLAEGVTCLVGIVMYCVLAAKADLTLAPWLMAGAVLSVPLAAHTLKRIPESKARVIVGVVVLGLGVLTLVKTLAG